MAKMITHLVGGAVVLSALLSSNSHAGACPQVTDSLSNLADQGLAEFYFSYYRASGDNNYLGLTGTTQSTVYADDAGQGFKSDPGTCGGVGTGGWNTETIAQMSVHIYTPAGEPTVAPHTEGKRPLMLSLHGCNQTNTLIRNKGNWQVMAEAYDMVVAVPDSVTSGFGNCWDSFGDGHNETNHDSDNVILLTETLRDRAELNIDPNQIYIAGLSSGGMQTMLVGCMRSDLYAGVGLASNPTIGTGSGDWGSDPVGPTEGRTMCLDLADRTGTRSSQETQLASIVFGDDSTVPGGTDIPSGGIDLDFFPQNAEIMAEIYGATSFSTGAPVSGYSSESDGLESTWARDGVKRVSLLDIPGLGHAWSTGDGAQDTDINGAYVNYPEFLMAFFHMENMRVAATPTPSPWPPVTPTPTPSPWPPVTPTPTPSPWPPVTPTPTPSPWPPVTPTPTPAPDCQESDTYNYYHKNAGRAYSEGSFWAPEYFAQGSNDAMPGSTWSKNTLYSYDQVIWSIGGCP